MPISQPFNINTGRGYAGDEYGLGYNNAVFTNTAVGAIPYGVVVQESGTGRGAAVGSAISTTGDPIYGLSIRQINRSATTYPSNGNDVVIEDGVDFPVMLEGSLYMVAGDGIKRGQPLYVDTVTGLVYGASGAKRVLAGNLIAIEAAATGEVFPVRVFQSK